MRRNTGISLEWYVAMLHEHDLSQGPGEAGEGIWTLETELLEKVTALGVPPKELRLTRTCWGDRMGHRPRSCLEAGWGAQWRVLKSRHWPRRCYESETLFASDEVQAHKDSLATAQTDLTKATEIRGKVEDALHQVTNDMTRRRGRDLTNTGNNLKATRHQHRQINYWLTELSATRLMKPSTLKPCKWISSGWKLTYKRPRNTARPVKTKSGEPVTSSEMPERNGQTVNGSYRMLRRDGPSLRSTQRLYSILFTTVKHFS
jgi:hypothetical protein